jgi:peptidoglycan/xylan/chitin deacetylase (PgdA/CDA1 family)
VSAIVLLYHRVTHLETDPQLLAVTPKHFAAQMQALRRIADPVRLSEIRDTGIAVTFDDGYADNLHEAAPLLKSFDVPATVFATTGHTDSTNEFFWDELDRLFLQPNVLPEKLELAGRHIDLTNCSNHTRAQHKGWNVLQPPSPASRQAIYLEFFRLLYHSTADQRAEYLSHLQQWSMLGRQGRESHRMMTSAELRSLAAGGVVEIGAHTVNHPLLAVESPQRQREEIETSKRSLENILNKPVTSFSYPFGTRRDYTSASVDASRAAGIEIACSNFESPVTAGTDRLQIPRFIVRDWDAAEFTQRVSEWLARPPKISAYPARSSQAADC